MNDTRHLNALFVITLLLFALSRLFADADGWRMPALHNMTSPRQIKLDQMAQQAIKHAGYRCPSPSRLRMDWDGDLLVSCGDNSVLYQLKGVLNSKKLKVEVVNDD